MKSTLLTIILAAGLFFLQSCRQNTIADNGRTVVEVIIDNLAPGEPADTIVSALAYRVNALYPDANASVMFDDSKQLIRIELKGVDSTAVNPLIFTAHGYMRIMEVVKCMDFFEGDGPENLPEAAKDTLSRLSIKFIDIDAIGSVAAKDTAAVARLLDPSRLKKPFSYILAWGRPYDFYYGDDTGNLPLYCLKVSRGNMSLNEGVKSSEVEESDYSENVYSVGITLTNEYAQRFQALTRENIDNYLAIVLDNVVLSAPRVHQEIFGGKIQITGNFDFAEAALFNAFLGGPVINSKLRIHSIKQSKINEGP